MLSNLTYVQMQLLCQQLQERILEFKVIDCFPNDPRRFFFVLRKNQQQDILFFCFHSPFMRFHLVRPFSCQHSSSHPLAAFLKEAVLKKVCLLNQDRILQLTFDTAKGERLFVAEFFSKHPNYYLLQSNGQILFSLYPFPHSHYQLPPIRSQQKELTTPQWNSHQEVEQAYAELEQAWEFNKEKQVLQTHLTHQIKRLQNKEAELQCSLNACAGWEQVRHEGNLIKAHLNSLKSGMSDITVLDWLTQQPYLLTLDPAKTPQEEMAARFRRAKKLQAGFVPLTRQLEQIQQLIHQFKQQQHTLESIQTFSDLIAFKTHYTIPSKIAVKHKQEASSPSIYREYHSAKEVKIWVGKSAKYNEKLTFQLANGRDWWLHVTGYPGSHVIIRQNKDQPPDAETLKDAMQLALFYSKARQQGEAEICWTQRKYVSRLGKGKTGQVQISQHQTAWVRFDPLRYRAIQERSKVTP